MIGNFDARDTAEGAIDDLDYRGLIELDDIVRALDTDTLVDIALYLMRMADDHAEMDDDEYAALEGYAAEHGIEG